MALRRLGATRCFFFLCLCHAISLDYTACRQMARYNLGKTNRPKYLNEPSARGGRLREKIRDY
jgi:hypothetical protein